MFVKLVISIVTSMIDYIILSVIWMFINIFSSLDRFIRALVCRSSYLLSSRLIWTSYSCFIIYFTTYKRLMNFLNILLQSCKKITFASFNCFHRFFHTTIDLRRENYLLLPLKINVFLNGYHPKCLPLFIKHHQSKIGRLEIVFALFIFVIIFCRE